VLTGAGPYSCPRTYRIPVEADRELELPGGRITPGVVRVGDTVRRPVGAHSPFVHRLLALLESRGVTAAPPFHGLDDRGREILTFHDGWVPPNLEYRTWSDEQLVAAARIVRELHDATAGTELAGEAEVVCHGDLSPCNFVFVDGKPTFVIDFDRAHPGSRKSDLAYLAWLWLIGSEDDPARPFAARLAQLPVLLDAYGLDDRAGFAAAIEAEQREVLGDGTGIGADWARSEVAFVRANAQRIDAAALG